MAFDPLSAAGSYLFSQAIDKISEETGMKERGSKIWSGLLNMFGPKEAMASDTGSASAAPGFALVQPQEPFVSPSMVRQGPQVELMTEFPRMQITPPGGDFTGPVQNMPLSETQVLNLPSRDVMEVDLTRPMYNRPAESLPVTQQSMEADEEALQTASDLAQMGLTTPQQVGAAAAQDSGVFNKIKGFMDNEEAMLGLALAINSLRQNSGGLTEVLGKRLETIRGTRQANRTAAVASAQLRKMGYNDWADLVEQRPEYAKEVLTQIMQKEFKPGAAIKTSGVQVDPQSGQLFVVKTDPNTGEITRQDVTGAFGLTPQGEAELEAASRIKEKDIQAAQEAGQKVFSQAQSLDAQLGKYEQALAALDEGANTDAWLNAWLPTVTEATARLQAAANSLGIDIINSATFGALSESELNLALRTGLPTNLPAAELKKYVKDKIEAQRKLRNALLSDARELVGGNTLYSDYIKKRANQTLDKIQESAPAQPRAAPQTSPQIAPSMEGFEGFSVKSVR